MTTRFKILYFLAGFFVAISTLYLIGKAVIEKTFPHFTNGWSETFYTAFYNVHEIMTPLVRLLGFIVLLGCFLSFFQTAKQKENNFYLSILPLVASAFLAMSCLFLAWGYALVGMIGLCSYLFIMKSTSS